MWIELTQGDSKISVNFNHVEVFFVHEEETKVFVMHADQPFVVKESYQEIKSKLERHIGTNI